MAVKSFRLAEAQEHQRSDHSDARNSDKIQKLVTFIEKEARHNVAENHIHLEDEPEDTVIEPFFRFRSAICEVFALTNPEASGSKTVKYRGKYN